MLGEETQNVHDELLYMTDIFDNIKDNVLKHIPQLGDNVNMGTKGILCNFGSLDEQKAHRDFSSKKRDATYNV